MLWALVLAGLMFAFVASSNRGYGRRFLRLSAELVSFVSWGMVAFCVLAAFGVVWLSFRRKADPKEVILRPDLLVIPKASINGGFFAVHYSDISSIATRDVASEKMLVITSRLGESRLLSSAFSSFEEFSRFSSEALAHWAAAKRLQVTCETRVPPA